MAANTLSLKEAESQHPKNIIKVNYKKTQISVCTAISLGEGSFGKVYKGWRSDGNKPIAVKIIDEHYLNQDPKGRENLEREISIMKQLKGCDNVVQIFFAGQIKGSVIITMEMCDYDLHKFLRIKESFSEQEVVDFLHQIGEGMKELRKQNIVHRDIKPQNILIKQRDDNKHIFKMADFGYARHFDTSRTKMMNSIVGTPLYMAPEALEVYLFPQMQAHYNDKVDIWSIGALLYKVLVGKDSFPAPSIPHVYEYLKSKKDNIAFEMNERKKPMYREELPEVVQRKLSPAFCLAITDLLVGMLKFDEKERFSFPTFFQKIEDIIESKIELINLLHGSSFKLIRDSCLTSNILLDKISTTWGIPQEELVVFSANHPKYISPHHQMAREEFQELIDKSGGLDGHAKLYVLSMMYLKADDVIEPDVSCLEPFKFAMAQKNVEYLIKNMRFLDEIIYMVQCLRLQLLNQRNAVYQLYQFAINMTGMSDSYNQLKKDVQQSLARVTLMVEVITKDLDLCGIGAEESTLPELLQELVKKEGQLKELEREFEVKVVCRPEDPFNWKECQSKISLVIDMTKKVKVGDIPANCLKLYQYCENMKADKTRQTRLKLASYRDILESTWSLYSKSVLIRETSDLLERIMSTRQQTYEGYFNSAPSERVDSMPSDSLRDYTSMLQGLRDENEGLRKKLMSAQNFSLETRKKYEEALVSLQSSEQTIKARNLVEEEASGPSYTKLCKQLSSFCDIGRIVTQMRKLTEEAGMNGHGGDALSHSDHAEIDDLLVQARAVAMDIRNSISFIRKDGVDSTSLSDVCMVKIANPEDYKAGDLVLMTAINTLSGSVPGILHLKWNNPHMLMDFKCLRPMGIAPGKVPQLFLARLKDNPQKLDLKNNSSTANLLGMPDAKGVFYRATVDSVPTQFSEKFLTLLSYKDQKSRPRPNP